MPPPTPVPDIVRLAAFVRSRLADVAVFAGRTAGAALGAAGRSGPEAGGSGPSGMAERAATVVIAPLAVFAPTSHARARLLRQMHASGLLTQGEVDTALAADAQHAGPLRALPPGA